MVLLYSPSFHAQPQLAYSVEILLHELGARLILQELHLLLELELSNLFLAAKWVLFPFDIVQFQLLLHTIELLLKLELVQLLLRLVQLLRAWLCCQTGATGCLLPKLVELPLRLIEGSVPKVEIATFISPVQRHSGSQTSQLTGCEFFRTANTAHLGRGIGQEQWLRVGPSEKYVAR